MGADFLFMHTSKHHCKKSQKHEINFFNTNFHYRLKNCNLILCRTRNITRNHTCAVNRN